MQTIKPDTNPGPFEIILRADDNSWSFSTFADAPFRQEALERAEKEFFVHTAHHELGRMKLNATSAYVVYDRDERFYTKRNGRWQPAQPAKEH